MFADTVLGTIDDVARGVRGWLKQIMLRASGGQTSLTGCLSLSRRSNAAPARAQDAGQTHVRG